MTNWAKYTHKEQWVRRGKGFNIEVCRWHNLSCEHIWNVYVYMFHAHPRFEKLKDDMLMTGNVFGFHSYCSYARWDYDADGKVRCKRYGSDYNHLDDNIYRRTSMPEMVPDVFEDADRIFDTLEAEAAEAEAWFAKIKKGAEEAETGKV